MVIFKIHNSYSWYTVCLCLSQVIPYYRYNNAYQDGLLAFLSETDRPGISILKAAFFVVATQALAPQGSINHSRRCPGGPNHNASSRYKVIPCTL